MYQYEEAKKRLEEVKIENGEITSIEYVPASTPDPILNIPLGQLPEHFRVCATLKPSPKSNILIEVWLPVNEWNGKFLGTGNGGSAGHIDKFSLMKGIMRGYAVANTDMGTAPDPDDLIGGPERWADFGHRSTHLMTVVAKQLIEAFYGEPPRHSYFTGGSTGGQQALMEAQRYPEDYDGIIAAAPANNRTHLHIAFIWNWLALTRNPNAAINREQATKITKLIVDHYAKESGGAPGDRFLSYPDRVDVDINIFKERLEELGLSPDQIDALEKNLDGPVNPVTGERIYYPLVVPGSENMSLGFPEQSDKEKFAKDFFYLFRWIFDKDFDFSAFDFDKHVEIINEKLAPILNANNADLSAFKNRGGKLIMIHGTADPIIPYTDSLHYYERVIEAQNGLDNTLEFFRYFIIPGQAHIFGGPGLQEVGMLGIAPGLRDRDHDVLMALEVWVEEGVAPDRLIGVAFKEGTFLKEIAFERPVFAYPGEAVYRSGDTNKAESYVRGIYVPKNVLKPAEKYLI